MLTRINQQIKRLLSDDGSIIFFLATLSAWIFLIGFSTDFGRTLVIKRSTYIQLDHALKAGTKQIDKDLLGEGQVVILENQARDAFSETLANGLGLTNTYPNFSPDTNTAYAGDLKILEFEVLNYLDPVNPQPLTDPLNSSVEFEYPTCHTIIEVPVNTYFWRWFGIDTMTFKIHADASFESML